MEFYYGSKLKMEKIMLKKIWSINIKLRMIFYIILMNCMKIGKKIMLSFVNVVVMELIIKKF
jgi:hypothetical protein